MNPCQGIKKYASILPYLIALGAIAPAFTAHANICQTAYDPNPLKTGPESAKEEDLLPEPEVEEPITLPSRRPGPAPDPLLPTTPAEQPERPPVRRAPNPFPDRPLKPTFDPKDIIPVELYLKDPAAKSLYAGLPTELKYLMQIETDRERVSLAQTLRDEFGITKEIADPLLLCQLIKRDHEKIHKLERSSEALLEADIRDYVLQHFDLPTIQSLDLHISSTLPERLPEYISPPKNPSPPSPPGWRTWLKNFGPNGASAPPEADPMSEKNGQFYRVRREVYNLLAQGFGWQAMEKYSTESANLSRIQPKLPQLYRRFFYLFRLLNYEMIDLISSPSRINTSDLREESSIGREIVEVTGKPHTDDFGNSYIELNEIKGIAVGKNGLALVHEAMKAAFQMATALEASQRMILNARERSDLELATNTNSAELRQAIYGPVVTERILGNLHVVLGDGPKFYTGLEQIFSISSASVFYEILNLVAEPNLSAQPRKLARLETILHQWVE